MGEIRVQHMIELLDLLVKLKIISEDEKLRSVMNWLVKESEEMDLYTVVS